MHLHLFDELVYTKRRQKLSANVGKGLILLMGNDDSSMNYADNTYPFRQDSTFLYYAGIDIAGLALVLDTESGEEILFGREAGIDDIIWTGPLPSLQDLAQKVGIAKTTPYAQLGEVLKKAKDTGRRIHILPPYRPENKIKLAEWLQLSVAGLQEAVSLELIKAVITQRECKDPDEIAEMEAAVSVSVDMHLAAMKYTRPGMKEYEIAAKVEEAALAAGGRLSYPTILTINGQVLHNHFHGNQVAEGHMILCDAGAETAMHYAGDLTRTFPVGKQFTTRQREMYQVVLDALDHAADLLKPGIQYKEVHTQASVKLVEGLKAIGLVKGDPAEAVAAGVHTLFFQCGLGHMIGLDVHDMEDLGEQYVGYSDTLKKSTEFGWKSLRLGRELKPGFVLTVEPGIYIIPELIDRWVAENKLSNFVDYNTLASYRDFGGIRIEDNFVITETGSRKLGKELPKTIAAVEALRQ
ncbi:aminopeptidase P family protein [Chitinophaga pinensis]|uniref:Xaa-Pro aminopeptidase n=1 Tax=Chitinophaga pinensis TaxID=79329 RepID=A0A5C6LKX8_9BACT|nr:aminopeptidase P family protein [Chitinophaga pinensis]TWV94349.1 aminopeptidase P family protein [Chitinophaga pinensis]TWV97414.1 aminopeptidase P family protein [Chitinophaga pinensis]